MCKNGVSASSMTTSIASGEPILTQREVAAKIADRRAAVRAVQAAMP
jgi:hypothetical protein